MKNIILFPLRVIACVLFALVVWGMVAAGMLVMIFQELWNATDE